MKSLYCIMLRILMVLLNYNDIYEGRRVFPLDIQVIPNKKGPQGSMFELNDFAAEYGHISHPIEIKHPGQKIAVRMISQFGEESTKVMTLTK
jgi:hypothetical protein